MHNLALGYTTRSDDGGVRKLDRKPRTNTLMLPVRGSPAGGGYSTVEDLYRFTEALHAGKLLNAEYTRMQLTGQVAQDTTESGRRYGFGMEKLTALGVRIIGHSGSFAGVNSQVSMYPELGYTTVVLSNDDRGA